MASSSPREAQAKRHSPRSGHGKYTEIINAARRVYGNKQVKVLERPAGRAFKFGDSDAVAGPTGHQSHGRGHAGGAAASPRDTFLAVHIRKESVVEEVRDENAGDAGNGPRKPVPLRRQINNGCYSVATTASTSSAFGPASPQAPWRALREAYREGFNLQVMTQLCTRFVACGRVGVRACGGGGRLMHPSFGFCSSVSVSESC